MNSPTIYFVQAQPPYGPVKIGYTRRGAPVRVAEGQTFSADEITILAETYGTMDDEKKLHRVFADQRIRGEWFAHGALLAELILHLLEGYSLQTWLEEV